MGFGIGNTPGAWLVKVKKQLAEVLARVGSVEKTLTGMDKISGTSAPTAQTQAKVGQIYINVITGEEWECVEVNSSGSVWKKLTKTGVALTAADINAVPITRKVNKKALSEDITLTAADVGARPNTWTPTASDVGAAPSSHGTHVSYSTTAPVMDGTASAGSAATVARSDHKHPTDTSRAAASHTHTASAVGAKASDWKPFHAGTSAPSDTTQFWIDTTTSDPKLKYHNGSAWVPVPVAFFVP